MVGHTVFAGTPGSSTGSGTEDTIASTGFYPTGESSTQKRGNTTPNWIGWDTLTTEIAQIGAVSLKDYARISKNTDEQAQILKMAFNKRWDTASKFGNFIGNGQPLWFHDVPLEESADWDARGATTTASKAIMHALYQSYGQKYPYRGGRMISRVVTFTSDDGVYPAFSSGPSITDLDPRLQYRIAGLQLAGVEDQLHLAAIVGSPSNNTVIGALLGSLTSTTFHANTRPVWFNKDSILVSGVESVVVQSSSVAAQKPSIIVIFEEYGKAGDLPAGTKIQSVEGAIKDAFSPMARFMPPQ